MLCVTQSDRPPQDLTFHVNKPAPRGLGRRESNHARLAGCRGSQPYIIRVASCACCRFADSHIKVVCRTRPRHFLLSWKLKGYQWTQSPVRTRIRKKYHIFCFIIRLGGKRNSQYPNSNIKQQKTSLELDELHSLALRETPPHARDSDIANPHDGGRN